MIRTPSKYSFIISPDKINDTASSLNESNWTETFLLLVKYENRFIWWSSSDHRQVWWLLNSCDAFAVWSKGLKKNNARTKKGFQIDVLNKRSLIGWRSTWWRHLVHTNKKTDLMLVVDLPYWSKRTVPSSNPATMSFETSASILSQAIDVPRMLNSDFSD